MGNIRFATFTEEAAAAEKEQLDAIAPTTKFFKPEQGDNIVRMFPPLPGENTPWVTGWRHFLKLPWLEKQTSIVCPRVMSKQSCPVCALAAQLATAEDPTYRKLAEDLEPQFSAIAVIVDRAHPEAGPQTWTFGKGIYNKLSGLRQNAISGGDFVDPDRGFDIVLTRKGLQKDTRYEVALARNASPLGDDDTIDYWLESFPDFRSGMAVKTSEEIIEALGTVPRFRVAQGTLTASRSAAQLSAPAQPPRAAGRPAATAQRAPLGTQRFAPTAPPVAQRAPARTAQAMVDDDPGETFEDPDLALSR